MAVFDKLSKNNMCIRFIARKDEPLQLPSGQSTFRQNIFGLVYRQIHLGSSVNIHV